MTDMPDGVRRSRYLKDGVEPSLEVEETTPEWVVMPRRPRRRRWRVAAIVVVTIGVGALGVNCYRSAHQTLHIVNGLAGAVGVSIDGGEPVEVAPGSRRTVTVAEGEHRATITQGGEAIETVDFQVEAGFFERFANDSVFVLNPRGAAFLLVEKLIYAAKRSSQRRDIESVYCGRSFEVFRDIDYAFREAPTEVKTEDSTAQKMRLSLLLAEPADVFAYLAAEKASIAKLRHLADHFLTLNPEDDDLLAAYSEVAVSRQDIDRCLAFLEKGLDRRPVAIAWHRTYQGVASVRDGHDKLLARYGKWLDEEPTSSAFLHLKGCVIDDIAATNGRHDPEALALYERAVAAEPTNAYPLQAKAQLLLNRGELAAARGPAAQAVRLRPRCAAMTETFAEIRLALRELDPLIEELTGRLEDSPTNLALHRLLLQCLVAKGAVADARTARVVYAHAVKAEDPKDPEQLTVHSDLCLLALEGDLPQFLTRLGTLKDEQAAGYLRFHADLELRNLANAETYAQQAADGCLSLLVHVAWVAQSNIEKANTWRQLAIGQLNAGMAYERATATVLSKADAATASDIEGLYVGAKLKAATLIALAASCPAKRAELLALAEKFNYDTDFPHRFLQHAIAAVRQRKQEPG